MIYITTEKYAMYVLKAVFMNNVRKEGKRLITEMKTMNYIVFSAILYCAVNNKNLILWLSTMSNIKRYRPLSIICFFSHQYRAKVTVVDIYIVYLKQQI